MLTGFGCVIPKGVTVQRDQNNDLFIQRILVEEDKVKEVRQQEIQSTAENPRIRDQNELREVSAVIQADNHKKFIEEKRRQQLRQNNMELRQLELQLRAAFVSKQLVDQNLAMENQKEAAKKAKREEDRKFEEERKRCQELALQKEIRENQRKKAFRGALLDQINDAEKRRKEEYAELLKDREEMQKVINRYKAEREKELEALERRKESAQKEIEAFKRLQYETKQRQRVENKNDLEEFLKMMQKQDEQNQRIVEERKKQTKLREEVADKIGHKLWIEAKEKLEREKLLLELLEEERNEKMDGRLREHLERQAIDRIQMRVELERYITERDSKKHTYDPYTSSFMEQQKKLLKEEIEKEAKKAEEIRRNKLEHGRAIQEMIEAARKQRATAAADELKLHEILRKQEIEYDMEVEDERLRMLSNAPKELLRYLPAGVIRDADRPILGLPTKAKK